ncbi:hypothetical protein [Aliamphritea spongicola]|uniref:hypothetical protein n=1 Tax=Aliamphritea spongicola TaxID=707589 RepID=UPI00196B9F5B|nr:hypothetical protein [Aliamphritea spongicola]MBN3564374.1 hypothetical protein [Aliamphritea spongicola]
MSLKQSLFSQVLNDLVSRLAGVLRAERTFAGCAGYGLRTPLDSIPDSPIAPQAKIVPNSCCSAKQQPGHVQDTGRNSEFSGQMRRSILLPVSQAESECEIIDMRSHLEALFREYRSLAESRDMTCTLFGEARVTAPPALVDTLLTALLHNGLNFGEEFVQFRLSDRGLQMLNPVGGSESGQDQDGNGLEIIRRICERYGWQLSYGYRKQVFVVNISFQPSEKSRQHCF